MKLTTGLVINDRYILQKQIAVGGMGEMWIGKDSVLGRDVAIKAMREEHAGNEDFLQRLRTEAKNNAALRHPNIVALHDYYEQSKIGFIIQEYIDGKSLAHILHETPIMPIETLAPILAQIARALGAAHKNGIVHRDVKPANILVQDDGVVKVVDFGVSRAADQTNMTQTGMVVGTAQYLSPEQAIGDSATAQSDIYALGVIAYEAACGKRPFGGKNAVDIAIAQVNQPVPPMPDELDGQFVKLVMKMLEKSTKNRPVDADTVAEEFEKIAANNLPTGQKSRLPFSPSTSSRSSITSTNSKPVPRQRLAHRSNTRHPSFVPSSTTHRAPSDRNSKPGLKLTPVKGQGGPRRHGSNQSAQFSQTVTARTPSALTGNSYATAGARQIVSNTATKSSHIRNKIDSNMIVLGALCAAIVVALVFIITNISNL